MGCSESKPEANGGASPLKRLSQRLSTGGSSKAYDAMVAARATKMAKRASDAHDSQTIKYVSQLKAVRGMKPPENMTLPTPNGKTANLPWLHPSRVGVVSLPGAVAPGLDHAPGVLLEGKDNQDFGMALHPFGGDASKLLVGVFDGHGKGGQYVSKLSGFSLAKSCKSEEESDVITSEGLLKTGLAFAEEQVKNKLPPAVAASAGTTAIVALLEDGKLTVANIGDSRLVKGSVRGGGGGDGSEETLWVPSWCSEDHKPNDPDEKARIQATGASVTRIEQGGLVVHRVQPPDAKPGQGLAVARSIGDEGYKPYGVCETPTLTTLDLDEKMDRCIVLGSDGLYEFMSNEEVTHICSTHRQQGASAAARALVLESAARWYKNSKTYRDDITCVCVFLPLDGAADTADVQVEMEAGTALAVQPSEFKALGFPTAWSRASLVDMANPHAITDGDEPANNRRASHVEEKNIGRGGGRLTMAMDADEGERFSKRVSEGWDA